jgi:hypothetical protein
MDQVSLGKNGMKVSHLPGMHDLWFACQSMQ